MDSFNRVPYVLYAKGNKIHCLFRESCPKKDCIEEEVSGFGKLDRCFIMMDYLHNDFITEEDEEKEEPQEEFYFKIKG